MHRMLRTESAANNRRDIHQPPPPRLSLHHSSSIIHPPSSILHPSFIFHPRHPRFARIMAIPASSNPITSVAPNSNPITSVSPNNYGAAPLYPSPTNPQLLSRLNLDLRGTIFPVEREMLMLLPESVLLGLFPQGLILSKPASWEGGDDGIFTVDVSPVCTEREICNSLDIILEWSTDFHGHLSLTLNVFDTSLISGLKLRTASMDHPPRQVFTMLSSASRPSMRFPTTLKIRSCPNKPLLSSVKNWNTSPSPNQARPHGLTSQQA